MVLGRGLSLNPSQLLNYFQVKRGCATPVTGTYPARKTQTIRFDGRRGSVPPAPIPTTNVGAETPKIDRRFRESIQI